MLKDAAWGLAAIGCLLLTIYSVELGVEAWREFDKDDPQPKTFGSRYDWWRAGRDFEPRAKGTGGRRGLNSSAPANTTNTNITELDDASIDDSEGATDNPEVAASSPYLFQPLRYMNKAKRSVYRQYKDGSVIVE